MARQVSAQLLQAPESRSNQVSTIWAEIGPKWPENGVKGNIWGQSALYNAPYRAKKIQKTGLFPRNRPVRQGKSDAGSKLVATQKLEVPGGPAAQALPGLFGRHGRKRAAPKGGPKNQVTYFRSRASFTLLMMWAPISREASTVWAPRWGVTTKLSHSNRGESKVAPSVRPPAASSFSITSEA